MYILKWTNICQITVVPMFSLSTLYTFEEFHIANYNYLCPLCPIHLELFRLTVRVGHAYKMERFQEMTKQTSVCMYIEISLTANRLEYRCTP